jgi:hypothetical protein
VLLIPSTGKNVNDTIFGLISNYAIPCFAVDVYMHYEKCYCNNLQAYFFFLTCAVFLDCKE